MAITRLERTIADRGSKTVGGAAKKRIRAIAISVNVDTIEATLAVTNNLLAEMKASMTSTRGLVPTNPDALSTTQTTDLGTPTKPTTTSKEPTAKPSWATVTASNTSPAKKSKQTAAKSQPTSESPMTRHHPRRVVVHWPTNNRIKIADREPATAIVDKLNIHLTRTKGHAISGATWTEAGNLVLIAQTPEDAKALVGNFGSWQTAIPQGAMQATLDQKLYQVVIQGAYIRNEDDSMMTADKIVKEIATSTTVDSLKHARPPRIMTAKEATQTKRSAILVSLKDEEAAITLRKGLFFRHEWCKVNEYVEPTRINRCKRCHRIGHATRTCTKPIQCALCASTEHETEEHVDLDCTSCTDKANCKHADLKCVNCNQPHASNDPTCPEWLKKKGMLKDPGPSSQQPKGGRAPREKKSDKTKKVTGPNSIPVTRKSNAQKTPGTTSEDPPTQQGNSMERILRSKSSRPKLGDKSNETTTTSTTSAINNKI
jgi:hypothetical protein